MTTMPSLYIGHGAPLLLDDPLWSSEIAAISKKFTKPSAILIVSAHWESAPISISSPIAGTPLVYDFGGFAQKYYEMTYETPDASALAARIAAMMPDHEALHQSNRGLDHGAWVPMKIMFPDADIPILQMSMPTSDPGKLIELGRRLRPLRDEGVLIIGSGFMTHGLPYIRDWSLDAKAPGWSSDFDAWAADAIARGDVDALASYKDLAPAVNYAHPTVEHFTPLFITLGAATTPDAIAETLVEGFWMGLSKRSLLVA
ncbi:COG3384 Aromatic ring-opening dioxygenase, catalytic LigB subunit related enzyme [Candidatus Nanopelagicaceae bacterium]